MGWTYTFDFAYPHKAEWKLRHSSVKWHTMTHLMWYHLVESENYGCSSHTLPHQTTILLPFHHTIIYPAQFLFYAGWASNWCEQWGICSKTTNCRDITQWWKWVTHHASQHSLIHLNLRNSSESPHITSPSCFSTFTRPNSNHAVLVLRL